MARTASHHASLPGARATATGAPARSALRWAGVGAGLVAWAGFLTIGIGYLGGAAGPYTAGSVVVALALAAALVFGVAANSTAGVLAWLVASLFVPVLANSALPAIDKLIFAALVGGWTIRILAGNRPVPKAGLTEVLMVAFLLLMIGSAVAPHALPAAGVPDVQTLILNTALYPLALFVIAREAMGNARAASAFLWTLVGIGAYLTVVIVFQKAGLQGWVFPGQILDPSLGIHPERGRGPLLNSAADGAVLITCFVAAMHLALQPSVRGRALAGVVAATIPVAVYLTGTRAIWLALAVVVMMGALFLRGSRRWYVAGVIAVAAFLALNWQTLTSEDRQAGGVASTSEIESRMNDLATLEAAIGDKPLLGWGVARYPIVNTDRHEAWGNIAWGNGRGDIAHNTPLVIMAELGAVGLALWLGILLCIIWISVSAWRVLPRAGPASRGLAFGFWSAMAAWAIMAITIDVRLFGIITALMFVWAGILAGLGDGARATGDNGPARHRSRPSPG